MKYLKQENALQPFTAHARRSCITKPMRALVFIGAMRMAHLTAGCNKKAG